MSEVEKLADIINGFFGCDAAYFDINPFDLATYLINNGVSLPVQCAYCEFWDNKHCAQGQGWCPNIAGYRYGTWFCKAGKRREQ